jgi:hypothetical protein
MKTKLIDFLLEYKNLGSLYHIVDFEKLFYILKNNVISSKNFSNISLTRNKMLSGYLGDSPASIFKLEIDGDKLSNNYKIIPYVYKSNTDIYFNDEREEQVKTYMIKNASKYIKKIIIIKSRLERLRKETAWFTTDGGYFESGRKNIPELLKEIITLIKERNIELYIQEKSVIKKDDDYINFILNHPIKKIHHAYAYYIRGHEEMEKSKYRSFKEVSIPLNKKNKKIYELVVGYNYENLYLMKEKPINHPNINTKDVIGDRYMQLNIFDFVYDNKDIIKETDDEILVKTAKLKHIFYVD